MRVVEVSGGEVWAVVVRISTTTGRTEDKWFVPKHSMTVPQSGVAAQAEMTTHASTTAAAPRTVEPTAWVRSSSSRS